MAKILKLRKAYFKALNHGVERLNNKGTTCILQLVNYKDTPRSYMHFSISISTILNIILCILHYVLFSFISNTNDTVMKDGMIMKWKYRTEIIHIITKENKTKNKLTIEKWMKWLLLMDILLFIPFKCRNKASGFLVIYNKLFVSCIEYEICYLCIQFHVCRM